MALRGELRDTVVLYNPESYIQARVAKPSHQAPFLVHIKRLLDHDAPSLEDQHPPPQLLPSQSYLQQVPPTKTPLNACYHRVSLDD